MQILCLELERMFNCKMSMWNLVLFQMWKYWLSSCKVFEIDLEIITIKKYSLKIVINKKQKNMNQPKRFDNIIDLF